jgi:GNAT superfamily N-acetyltransferase
MKQPDPGQKDVWVRPLRNREIDEADHIFRLAFGTFVGMPQPVAFMAGAQLVRFRWNMNPQAFLAAELDGQIVATNFASNWGRFGYFGPLAVRPDHWDKGIAQRLLDATMALFEEWGTEHAALFTFPDSFKHIRLYQKYGFWPRYLTAVLRKEVGPIPGEGQYSKLSTQNTKERASWLGAVREITESLFPGLDLTREIDALLTQHAGDVVFVEEGGRLMAFALAHYGPGSEAEAHELYVKFGAVRSVPGNVRWLEHLLQALEDLATRKGIRHLVAGVSTERRAAYGVLLNAGFREALLGVAMHRPDDNGYNRADALIIDDLR